MSIKKKERLIPAMVLITAATLFNLYFTAAFHRLFSKQNNRPYQSELIKVADDIYTPAPTGQYQHGSSRWLKEEEWEQVFRIQTIDPHNPVIHMLLETGYDNLPFPKNEGGTKQTQYSRDGPAESINSREDG